MEVHLRERRAEEDINEEGMMMEVWTDIVKSRLFRWLAGVVGTHSRGEQGAAAQGGGVCYSLLLESKFRSAKRALLFLAARMELLTRLPLIARQPAAARGLPLPIARQLNAPCRAGSKLPPHARPAPQLADGTAIEGTNQQAPHARRSSPMALQSNAPTSKPPAHPLPTDCRC